MEKQESEEQATGFLNPSTEKTYSAVWNMNRTLKAQDIS